jgi:succinate dehydrogenase/fumarate reductase flavoprotein subunit
MSQPPARTWIYETDILVVGSGAAGLSAALFAALKGARVLLCEKTAQVGGTTASSGGIVWAPGNFFAKRAGVVDPPEKVRAYLRAEFGNHDNAELTDAFIDAVPKAIATLHDETEVKFVPANFPDYHPDLPGASESGRALEAARFDGRRLRRDFRLVRPPLPQLMLLGGMQVDKRKVDDFLNPFRSPATFLRIAKTILRYAADRTRYPRGTDLCAGNALVAGLLFSLLQRKGEVWVNSPIRRLIEADGAVLGAVVESDGKEKAVRARAGVILATGGFPASAAMRREFSSKFPHDITFGFEGNVGDGINAARAIGVGLDDDLVSTGYWQPSSKLPMSDGTQKSIMYGYLDRGRPGVIAVDRAGRRFVNESNSYHDVGLSLIKAGIGEGNVFHFVCDKDFVWHHGLGMIRPFNWNLRKFERMGYITMADTIAELARKISVDPEGLKRTIVAHNGYAETGVDLEFGKGSTAYNRLFGHPRVKGPNKNLAPIRKPPFVALRIYPGTLGTAVGLRANGNGQVLRGEQPVGGLYAAGNDMAAVMRGAYPGGGITLAPAIAFAYRAVEHALSAPAAAKN